MDEKLNKESFDVIDYIVFVGMLGVSGIVGIYHAWKERNNNNNVDDAISEYLVGGKNMSIFPISMSLIASYISGIAILGLPAEMYVYGTQLWCVVIADLCVSLTMSLVYLPVFYGLQITSSYEYLELRFNHIVRRLGSIIFIIKMLLYIPLVIYVPALAFNQVTGISLDLVAPLVCAVCIFYTTLGGIKAVVWTDTIQTVVMFGGVLAVAIIGTCTIGGIAKVWSRNFDTGRIEFFNMNMDPTIRHTFWGVVVGNYLNWLATCSVNQAMVQRCLAMPNLRKANITIIIMAIGIVLIVSLSCYTGLVIFAAYYHCDPVSTMQIRKPDQLLPFFVMDMATVHSIPGLPGLFVSGVFSAALSTMSTGLNSMSGVIYEDMIKPLLSKDQSSAAHKLGARTIMKITVLIIGIICLGLVFLVEKLTSLIQAGKSLSGITAGPLLAIFTLGMFFPCANSTGALVGGLVSLNLVAWISLGSQAQISSGGINFPVKPVSIEGCSESLLQQLQLQSHHQFSTPNLSLIIEERIKDEQPFILYRMSYLWYTWVGFITAILVGLFVSWITGPNKYKPSDKKLYTPVIHNFLPQTKTARKSSRTELDEIHPEITTPNQP